MALVHCRFHSRTLNLNTSMHVILPRSVEDAAAPCDRKYPTLYLLHGLSDDDSTWSRRTSLERYVDELDLAVVMPNVHRSYYTDSVTQQRYWTFISEELPVLARRCFPLSDKRADNYVAGLSMGGYGAFKLALRHPDRFAAAASLSGALDIVSRIRADETAEERGLKYIFGDCHSTVGSTNDLFFLADRLVKQNIDRPALFQWCGTEDFLLDENRRFANHLKGIGLASTYIEDPGHHDWECWDRQIQTVLNWLPLVETCRGTKWPI